MHILQAVRNVNQLNSALVRLSWGQEITHKLSAVDLLIPLDEVVDVSIFHPLRNQSEPVFTHCYSEERQDIGVSEVFPSNALLTEPLQPIRSDRCGGADRGLTLRM